MTQAYAVCTVVGLAFAGLFGSNLLRDRLGNSALSRRAASTLGGGAFLCAVLWLEAWTAVAVAGALTLLIVGLRLGFKRQLRGSAGRLPSQAWAEMTFALGGTLSLAIGWGIFDQRWLAFLAIAFMAWGDNAAGLVRDTIWETNMGSIWASLAMLGVGLGVAAIYQPYWIGACGAATATLAERHRPRFLIVWDDNLVVVLGSLGAMLLAQRWA